MPKSLMLGVVAGAVLAGAQWLPLALEENIIVPAKNLKADVQIEAGESIQQRLVLPAGTYAGVDLYGEPTTGRRQPVAITVRDKQGKKLAQGRYAQIDFPPTAGESRRIRVRTSWWRLPEPGQVFIEVKSYEKQLQLKVAQDIYNFGEISGARDELRGQDMVVTLLSPVRLPFGARQGATVGVGLMLGLWLVGKLPGGRRRWLAAAGVLALAAPLALAGYWWSVDRLGIADWDYYFSLHHAYRQIILSFGEFPWWNPYTCGGTAGLADPEFPGLTLTFLLELIFGIEAGLRLAIYLSVAVGAGGMLALARRLKISVWGGVLAALAVAFGTVNLLEITEGHVNVFAAMWLPWIFWSWLGAYRQSGKDRQHTSSLFEPAPARLARGMAAHSSRLKRDTVPARRHNPARRVLPTLLVGIFLALTFYQGGIYLLMYVGLTFLALIALVARPRAALLVTLQAAAWALGLTAFKLVPVLMWLAQFPDETYARSAYTLPWLREILLGRHLHGVYIIPEQNSGWHEYGAFVGYFVFGAAVVALAQIKQRRVQILLIGFLAAALLSALGPHLEMAFDVMWWFPRSNISRVILLGVMALALLAGIGLDWLRRWLPEAAVIIIVGLAAVEIFSLSYQLSEQAFVLPPVVPGVTPAPQPIVFTAQRFDPAGQGARTTRAYEAARVGYGTMAYCSVLGPGAHVRTIEDEGGSRLISAAHSDVEYEVQDWSPAQVRVRVRAPASDTLTLNTNYAAGWQVNGENAQEIGGLVGIPVEAGEFDLTFNYQAPGWRIGLAITLLALGAGLTVGVKKLKILLK